MTARETHTAATAGRVSARARDYFALTKPKVVSLIMFTAIVGMFLAVPGFPPAAGLVWVACALLGMSFESLVTFGGSLDAPAGMAAWWALSFIAASAYAALMLRD